ncbi:MAG: hypothetical protein ACI4M3_00875, partial [Acutalibacteraceae bacterium]
MLPKSKKILRGFISAILSLQVLISPCLIASANDLTGADINSDSSSLSNETSLDDIVKEMFSSQELIDEVLIKADPTKAVEWAAKKFISAALGIDDNPNETAMLEKLDALMDGQSKLQKSMDDLSTQITCAELDEILRDFKNLKHEGKIVEIAYKALKDIDEDQAKSNTESNLDFKGRRISALTEGIGIDKNNISSANCEIDIYTNKLAAALLEEMDVTYEKRLGAKSYSDNLFEIKYQSLRRKYHWENQAYVERIDFQNDAFGTYAMTVTIEKLSLYARLEKIEKYNKEHPGNEKGIDMINAQLDQIEKDYEKIVDLMNKKKVVKRENERYYWTPGHEMIFYMTPNTQGVPQENKNAGVGNTKARNNAKGLKEVKNKSGNYTMALKYDFWKPFVRYEGGNSLLVNYDQLNTILKDYNSGGEKKSLYEIFFSKDEGNFDLPENIDENCTFVIDGQKSEITGKSYPLTYEPYFFKADQVYCYGVKSSGTSNGNLPSPSKIHLCYYHSGHADPKTANNCVGIGVKSVGLPSSNTSENAKEETYNNYNETIVWSENMDDIQLPLSENIGDLISVSADDNIITEDKYSISDDKTQITLKKEFLLNLEDGVHTLVVESDDVINRFSFTVKAEP